MNSQRGKSTRSDLTRLRTLGPISFESNRCPRGIAQLQRRIRQRPDNAVRPKRRSHRAQNYLFRLRTGNDKSTDEDVIVQSDLETS